VFCIYNIIAILDGLIYFRQVSQLAGFHAGCHTRPKSGLRGTDSGDSGVCVDILKSP
jgi:hypothetical protein